MQNKLTNREQSLIEENNDLKRTIASLNRFIDQLKGEVDCLREKNIRLLDITLQKREKATIPNGWKIIVNNSIQ